VFFNSSFHSGEETYCGLGLDKMWSESSVAEEHNACIFSRLSEDGDSMLFQNGIHSDNSELVQRDTISSLVD
jgi:hypothetical protein